MRRYGSVCSGIEAATAAWHPMGWEPAFFSEIEKFPSHILAHHYPRVPNRGDMTKFREWPLDPIDLLVGGTPCQSFSVAGLRKGMDDPRGNLMLTFGSIAQRYRPQWLVWENVPGVLSSNGGRDFGSFLGMLAELGYGFAYRVLDAQYVRTCGHAWAVPQRRRRVFVVGYLGDWRRAAAVLFDGESLSGNPAPRREAGEGTSKAIAHSLAVRGREGTPQIEMGDNVANAILTPNGGRAGIGVGAVLTGVEAQDAANEHLIASTGDVAHFLNAGGMGRIDYESETMVAHTLRGVGFDAGEDGSGRGTPLVPVAFDLNQITSKTNRSQPDPSVHHTLPAASCPPHLATQWAVRRLMPVECERLQGFPDGFTDIPWRGGRAVDGPRYKALGNSMAVNVMTWLGERIQMVEDML